MIGFLFRCIACLGRITLRADGQTFPVCSICFSTLFPCPSLCSQCGGPACLKSSKQECLRPWIQHPSIHSFSALYLLLNSEFPVLRKWKTRRGLLFDRRVLVMNPQTLAAWRKFNPQAVIPVPQAFTRAWKMGGGPAMALARWVSKITHLPLVEALLPPRALPGAKRQAQLSLQERFQKPLRFRIREARRLRLERVILVDDFMTSGRTLSQASAALRLVGVQKVHAFCLGVRTAQWTHSSNQTPIQSNTYGQHNPTATDTIT